MGRTQGSPDLSRGRSWNSYSCARVRDGLHKPWRSLQPSCPSHSIRLIFLLYQAGWVFLFCGFFCLFFVFCALAKKIERLTLEGKNAKMGKQKNDQSREGPDLASWKGRRMGIKLSADTCSKRDYVGWWQASVTEQVLVLLCPCPGAKCLALWGWWRQTCFTRQFSPPPHPAHHGLQDMHGDK